MYLACAGSADKPKRHRTERNPKSKAVFPFMVFLLVTGIKKLKAMAAEGDS
jgi:hypothetical protein